MKKRNFLFCVLLVLLSSQMIAQINLKNAQGELLGYLREQYLLDTSHHILMHCNGNLVFEGNSTKKEAILLAIEPLKNKTNMYLGVATSPTFFIKNETIFWLNNREEIPVAFIKKEAQFIAFYHAKTDSLIAYLETDAWNEQSLSLVFYYLWQTTTWEQHLASATKQQDALLPEGIIGYMQTTNAFQTQVWFWDGETFFPTHINEPLYVWTFDGQTIKPQFYSRIENEWSWNGEELKPFWGGHPRNIWRWEGNLFRQVFDNNYKNEYELVDQVARKRFGNSNDLEWQIYGEVPLPLVGMVLLGLVYR